jgi:hypothetical protein
VTDTTVRHAETGLRIETANPFAVSSSTLETNNTGMRAAGASVPTIQHTAFTGNPTAVTVADSAAPDFGGGFQSSAGYNTLIGTTMSLENGTVNPISAQYNWWGCPTTAEMDAGSPNITLIYDHADDPGRGAVDYAHWFGGGQRIVQAAKDTQGGARDVVLTWPQEPTGALAVLRGTDPQSLSQVGTTSGASWRDAGALDAPGIYYYEVNGPCP